MKQFRDFVATWIWQQGFNCFTLTWGIYCHFHLFSTTNVRWHRKTPEFHSCRVSNEQLGNFSSNESIKRWKALAKHPRLCEYWWKTQTVREGVASNIQSFNIRDFEWKYGMIFLTPRKVLKASRRSKAFDFHSEWKLFLRLVQKQIEGFFSSCWAAGVQILNVHWINFLVSIVVEKCKMPSLFKNTLSYFLLLQS